MSTELHPATCAPASHLSYAALARELRRLPPTGEDRGSLPRVLSEEYLREGRRAPWLWLSNILEDRGYFAHLAEGKHPVRLWLRPAHTAGWSQRDEAPDWLRLTLHNHGVSFTMNPWADLNFNRRIAMWRHGTHGRRLDNIEEAAAAALGPPRAKPSVRVLYATALASERARFAPDWHEKASAEAHAAQIVFEVFWLGLIQGSRRGPNPLLHAVRVEYLG
jgi:hypothetical protein